MSGAADAVRFWREGEPLDILLAIVARGGVLAVPTESSYALAVDPCNPRAVEEVYRLKGRPSERALPVAVTGREQLERLGLDLDALPPAVLAAIERLWPAPLTVVLPLASGRSLPAATGGPKSTLAVRVPEHAGLRRLLAALGPLTVTSANRSGEPPVLEPQAAAALVAGADAAVVDGGELAGGDPSTLVDWQDGAFRVLRRGRFDPARLPSREAR